MQLQAIGLHHVAECLTVFFGASQESLVTGHLGIFVPEFVEVIEVPYGEKNSNEPYDIVIEQYYG